MHIATFYIQYLDISEVKYLLSNRNSQRLGMSIVEFPCDWEISRLPERGQIAVLASI